MERTRRRLGLALLVLAAAGLSTACGEPASRGVTVEDITENPARWVGKVATVRGEIESVHGPGLFTLEAPGANDDMLVYTPDSGPVQPGEQVWVTGPVRILAASEVERELGLHLAPELEIEFESRPVMMSADVTVHTGGQA